MFSPAMQEAISALCKMQLIFQRLIFLHRLINIHRINKVVIA